MMIPFVAAMCAAFAQAGVANAAAEDQEYAQKVKELSGAGAAGSFVQNFTYEGVVISTTQISTTQWSGACINGLKDGPGSFTIKSRTDTKSDSVVTILEQASSGLYVRGQPAGLNCNDIISYIFRGKSVQSTMPHYCTLALGDLPSPNLVKQTDGNWQVKPATPTGAFPIMFATASDVDAISASANSRVKTGDLTGPIEFKVQIPDAADLVQNGEFTLALNSAPLQLKSKRVAIVLTSNTEKEFARFNTMRKGFFSQTAGVGDIDRKDYIARSDPKNMLINISTAFAGQTAGLQSAGDLSVLGDGGVDYVALADWRFKGNFNLSRSEFRALPVCEVGDDESRCPLFLDYDLSILLISKELKIVRAWSTSGGAAKKYSYEYKENSLDEFFHQMYSETTAWDKDVGIIKEIVKQWLEEAK